VSDLVELSCPCLVLLQDFIIVKIIISSSILIIVHGHTHVLRLLLIIIVLTHHGHGLQWHVELLLLVVHLLLLLLLRLLRSNSEFVLKFIKTTIRIFLSSWSKFRYAFRELFAISYI